VSKAGESMNALLVSLQERAKELDCLYRIDEILGRVDTPLHDICEKIVQTIPPGWQYPEVCWARIELEGTTVSPADREETVWKQQADIVVQGQPVGHLSVFYSREMPTEDEGSFLKEETKLLRTICDRIGNYILQQRMREAVRKLEQKEKTDAGDAAKAWREALDTLDWNQRCSVSARMLEELLRAAIPQAEALYDSWIAGTEEPETDSTPDPATMKPDLVAAIFELAAGHFNDQQIHDLILPWSRESRQMGLSKLVDRNISVADIADEIWRYHRENNGDSITSPSRLRSIQAALVRRFLTDHPGYMSVARDHITLADFNKMLRRTIFSADSHDRLGGQSARFFLGEQIIKNRRESTTRHSLVETPRTWHVTSGVLFHFLQFLGLDNTVEQKYKDIDHVRAEYPDIVSTFRTAPFPADIVDAVSAALDDLGDSPLVVRHSSVLDSLPDVSFAGKYRTVFVANRGSRQERIDGLLRGIAEVYASMFGPTPISYRSEHGILDLGEEMGVMIQQAVGTRVGKYFLPSFSGTACSRCDQLWLPELKPRDGLIYLVPGLNLEQGAREEDDYPVLVVPRVSGKCVYDSVADRIRYSPKNVHVLDLDLNCHATVSLSELMAEGAREMPWMDNVLSVAAGGELRRLHDDHAASADDNLIVTFEGLMSRTPVISQIKWVMRTFEEEIGGPVEVAFASDGIKLFVLDYRMQDSSK